MTIKRRLTIVAGISLLVSTAQAHRAHSSLIKHDVPILELMPVEKPALVLRPIHLDSKALFDTDKSNLRAEGKTLLDSMLVELADAARNGSPTSFEVIGHTDSRASYKYNQKLSERRAASVKKYLTGKGFPAGMIISKGKGETQPIATNRTKNGMQKNRRVEIQAAGGITLGVTDK